MRIHLMPRRDDSRSPGFTIWKVYHSTKASHSPLYLLEGKYVHVIKYSSTAKGGNMASSSRELSSDHVVLLSKDEGWSNSSQT